MLLGNTQATVTLQLFGLHEGAAAQQLFVHLPLPAERALHTWIMLQFLQKQGPEASVSLYQPVPSQEEEPLD